QGRLVRRRRVAEAGAGGGIGGRRRRRGGGAGGERRSEGRDVARVDRRRDGRRRVGHLDVADAGRGAAQLQATAAPGRARGQQGVHHQPGRRGGGGGGQQ